MVSRGGSGGGGVELSLLTGNDKAEAFLRNGFEDDRSADIVRGTLQQDWHIYSLHPRHRCSDGDDLRRRDSGHSAALIRYPWDLSRAPNPARANDDGS